jgi:hypothetical protein
LKVIEWCQNWAHLWIYLGIDQPTLCYHSISNGLILNPMASLTVDCKRFKDYNITRNIFKNRGLNKYPQFSALWVNLSNVNSIWQFDYSTIMWWIFFLSRVFACTCVWITLLVMTFWHIFVSRFYSVPFSFHQLQRGILIKECHLFGTCTENVLLSRKSDYPE